MTIEYIIYGVIAFFIIRFTIDVIAAVYEEDHPPKKQTANVKVRMEQFNNCWYGYYHPIEGGEIFVAQGNTFEEAVENCRERLNDKSARFQFNLQFEKT